MPLFNSRVIYFIKKKLVPCTKQPKHLKTFDLLNSTGLNVNILVKRNSVPACKTRKSTVPVGEIIILHGSSIQRS